MKGKKIRVLVVDDSAFLRRTLPRILESEPDIEVVGAAADGAEGLEMVKTLRPDVVTLDVLMPVMDGLIALRQIMREAPTPVIMLSSMTREGAAETIEALSIGAVDFVTKPSGTVSLDIDKVGAELIEKVKRAVLAKVRVAATVDVKRQKLRQIVEKVAQTKKGASTDGGKSLVAIAASTGGPLALQLVLPRLPANLGAGVVVVQHIAEGFTRALADRLNGLSQLMVREAEDGAPIIPGTALLAPAGAHLVVEKKGDGLVARRRDEPSDHPHKPSADVLFRSIADLRPERACAVILTGMGDDGARGMRDISTGNGWTIAQDEASSLIYGMPRRAVEMGGVRVSLPIDQIAAEITRVTS